jgi:hypothetical protein
VSRANPPSEFPRPITTNDYALEIFQGPILAPSRVSGLAGAWSAAVEGVEGVYDNAAAPAVREPFSLKWFDYDVVASVGFPGAYSNTDFNNRGEVRNRVTDDFTAYNLGAQLQFGPTGATFMADALQYDVEKVTISIARMHAVLGYGLLNNQLVIGAGARIAIVRLAEQAPNGARISMAGAAPEIGTVIKPDDVPWRIGATVRAPVTATDLHIGESSVDPVTKARMAGQFVVPSSITQPWEIETGVAYQLGPRPLNPRWINPSHEEDALVERIAERRRQRESAARAEIATLPHGTEQELAARNERIATLKKANEDALKDDAAELDAGKRLLFEERKARYLNWPRERLLLLGSLLIVGQSEEAVGLEGFIEKTREVVGQHVNIAPRFAVESEPVPNFLRLRAGVYIEPSRFEEGTKREHFTFGGDLRTITWDLWGLVPMTTIRLSGFVDLSPRYFNFGGGIGVWH